MLSDVMNLDNMNLAPNVIFDEDKHEYWYKGKQLSGITGLISKKLNLKFPEGLMSEHQAEGIHVHKAIQKWIETGKVETAHPGVVWLVNRLKINRLKEISNLYSEILVSDFKKYASAVDIIERVDTDKINIYDIKKGKFNRDYVTWQLSIYKFFIETYTEYKVEECTCICLRDQEFYKIFPKKEDDIIKLLYR